MHLLIFSLIALVYSFGTQATTIAKLQYAGEIGVLAVGMGKQFESGYSFSLLYGRVPEKIAGNVITKHAIETYAFKNQMRLANFSVSALKIESYLGIALLYINGKGLNSGQSKSYPANYYALTSWRGLLYWGVEILTENPKDSLHNTKHGFYLESAINDVWLINYFNNQKQVKISDYVALALGWNYYFL